MTAPPKVYVHRLSDTGVTRTELEPVAIEDGWIVYRMPEPPRRNSIAVGCFMIVAGAAAIALAVVMRLL